jgi:hypothetical protein
MHRIARLSVEARHAWALGYLSGLNNESETLRPLWQMDAEGHSPGAGSLICQSCWSPGGDCQMMLTWTDDVSEALTELGGGPLTGGG